jgi:hypothetical protein
LDDSTLNQQPFYIIDDINPNWCGKEDLYVSLLKRKNIKLASGLLGSAVPPYIEGVQCLDIGDISWWLDWIIELLTNSEYERAYWVAMQIASLITNYTDKHIRDKILELFNDGSSYRPVILKYLLAGIESTTDEYSEDAISYIFSDLNKNNYDSFHGHFLGNAATDQFAIDYLVPLLSNDEQPLHDNVVMILEMAGSRHGKRYSLYNL